MKLTRGTVTMAASLLDPARERQAAGKPGVCRDHDFGMRKLGSWSWRVGEESSRQGEAEAAWGTRALFGSTRAPSLHSKEPPLHPNSIFFLPENSPSKRLTQGIDCHAFTQAFCIITCLPVTASMPKVSTTIYVYMPLVLDHKTNP